MDSALNGKTETRGKEGGMMGSANTAERKQWGRRKTAGMEFNGQKLSLL